MIVNYKPAWERVISASHEPLFNVDYLLEMGAYFRDQYEGTGTRSHKEWPDIPLEYCKFPQANSLHDRCAGFDLPLLFTPTSDEWNGEVVALVSQDPLRKPAREGDSSFTIATPWGFSNRAMKDKAGNKKIWPSVEALCRSGYGVYLTDAAKLYLHNKNEGKWEETSRLERGVLRDEIGALAPKLCIALGKQAGRSLKDCGVEFESFPHPTAREKHLIDFYGTATGRHEEIAEAMKKRILELLGVA